MSKSNPFTAELSPSMERWLFIRCLKVPVAPLILIFLTLVVLLFGHFARSNALSVRVETSVIDDTGSLHALEPTDIRFGYLVELSHGLFYLLIAPAAVFLALQFLSTVGHTLRTLATSGRLRHTNGRSELSMYTNAQRRFFRKAVVVLPLMMMVLLLSCEYLEYKKSAAGNPALGYTQAPHLELWVNTFNSGTVNGKLTLLPQFQQQIIRRRIQDYIGLEWPHHSKRWGKYLRMQGVPTGSITQEGWANAFAQKAVELEGLAKPLETRDAVLTAKIGREGPQSPAELGFHKAFLIGLILSEGGFLGFGIWIALKILFLLYWLHQVIAGKNRTMTIHPILEDSEHKYGLSELHDLYNKAVLLILIASFGFALSQLSNADKGTSADRYHEQLVPLVFVVVCLAAIFYLPGLLFHRKLDALRKKALDELNDEEGLAKNLQDKKMQKEIECSKGVIRKQTTWPSEDSDFRKLLLAAVLFAVMPWITRLTIKAPENQWFEVPALCHKAALWFSEKVYPPPNEH